jgi:acyl-coenzyme A synthetase/AMP-(fatty) acid ligase
MLPIARYRRAEDPLLVGPAGPVASGVFFARAQALALALPEATHVVNLCATREGFMLAFAAALLRGQVSLLPPGQAAGDADRVRARHPGAYTIDESLITRLMPAHVPAAAEGLGIPGEQVAAILFTSGSTGEPAAHAKTWSYLCRGAQLLAAAIGWDAQGGRTVVGSVPPQHMFGLEATVMLPWQTGAAIHAGKPLLPADLEAALVDLHGEGWWMTTPMHLRAPLQSGARLARLGGAIASTMSLPPALAREAEALWRIPVFEVYGSTETGALAVRRTGATETWNPLAGVALRAEGTGEDERFIATGEHIAGAVVLGDALELHAGGGFRWLGRAGDLVKVAGKRASRAALDHALLEIAGVQDGAFAFAPGETADESHPVRRLAAFYVSATLSPPEVLAALRGRIDAAFLPRPLHRVARLPRDANGKLTRAAMESLFAQAQAQSVPATHPALPGHFPGDPIVPGVVVLARVSEAIAARCPGREVATLVQVRFHRPLRPGEAFTIELRIDGAHVDFRVEIAEGVSVASGRWALRDRPA